MSRTTTTAVIREPAQLRTQMHGLFHAFSLGWTARTKKERRLTAKPRARARARVPDSL